MELRRDVAAARAQLAQSQTQRARAVVRSPVTGVVLARQVDPGQTVAASFNTPTLFVIAEDLSAMKLEVSIDEADVGSVKQGQKDSFIVDAFPGQTFPAVITRVDIGSNLSATAASASSASTSGSATTGRLRDAASKIRRLTKPHCPPDMCCSISSASDPSVSPRQNRNPISQERMN